MFIFLIFFLFFLIYIPPLITFSDGAEFALSFCSLGLSHPPSYPLFINLSKIFYFIPVGNIYLRLCLFTAIISTLIFYLLWHLYRGDFYKKIALSIFLLSSENFFENTLIGEVYGLNLLFFMLLFFLIDRLKDRRCFYLNFFLLGLAIGNHHTIILILPYFLYQVYKVKDELKIRDFSMGLLFFVFGLSVYLYLPLRAYKEPLWNWGNPKNLLFFLTSLFRWDFANKGIMRPLEHFLNQIFTLNPVYEVGILNTILALGALVFIFFKDKKTFLKSLLILFSFSLLIVILIGSDDIEKDKMFNVYSPFYMPAYFILAYLVGESVGYLDKRLKYIAIVLIFMGFMINLKDYLFNFELTRFAQRSHNYTKSEMAMLPHNSVLIVEGGEKDFSIMYKQKAEKFREDITVIPLSMLGKKWNFKESIQTGVAYTKGYEGEINHKKAILKAVIMFQKEFRGKRVFTNIFDKEELPDSLKLNINGLFNEYGLEEPIDIEFLRLEGLDPNKDTAVIDIIYSNILEFIERRDKEWAKKYLRIFKSLKPNNKDIIELEKRVEAIEI